MVWKDEKVVRIKGIGKAGGDRGHMKEGGYLVLKMGLNKKVSFE